MLTAKEKAELKKLTRKAPASLTRKQILRAISLKFKASGGWKR